MKKKSESKTKISQKSASPKPKSQKRKISVSKPGAQKGSSKTTKTTKSSNFTKYKIATGNQEQDSFFEAAILALENTEEAFVLLDTDLNIRLFKGWAHNRCFCQRL
jgi:hypothetical protein